MQDDKNERLRAAILATQGKIATNEPLGKGEFEIAARSLKSQIADALPTALKDNAMKYVRQATILFNETPLLQRCTPISILGALIKASTLGLDLSTQTGQCYIIPYRRCKNIDGRRVWLYEAALQLGYKGIINLAYRSKALASIEAETVHQQDYFTYKKGLHKELDHIPDDSNRVRNKDSMTHAYAIAHTNTGGLVFDVWPKWRIEEHAQKYSQSYYKKDYSTGNMVINPESPWHKHFEAMSKKTLILAIWKYLPLETELVLAAAVDNSITTDANVIKSLTKEADILGAAQEYTGDAEIVDEQEEQENGNNNGESL